MHSDRPTVRRQTDRRESKRREQVKNSWRFGSRGRCNEHGILGRREVTRQKMLLSIIKILCSVNLCTELVISCCIYWEKRDALINALRSATAPRTHTCQFSFTSDCHQQKGRKLSNVTVMGVGKFSSGGLVVLLQEMSNPGGPFKRISFFMVILYNFICMKNPTSFSNIKKMANFSRKGISQWYNETLTMRI